MEAYTLNGLLAVKVILRLTWRTLPKWAKPGLHACQLHLMPVMEDLRTLQAQQLQPLQPQPQQQRPPQLQLDLDLLAAFNGGLEMVSVIQKTIRLHVNLIKVIAALLTLTNIGTGGAKGLINASARNKVTAATSDTTDTTDTRMRRIQRKR